MTRLIVCLLLLMSSIGCAAETPKAVKNDGPAAAGAVRTPPSKGAVPDIAPDHVVDNSGEYEYVNTPFGFVKRRVGKGGSPPSASPFGGTMEAAPPPAPAGRPAEPVPAPAPEVKKEAVPPPAAARPVPAAPPTPAKTEKKGPEGGVALNFDDADLYEVIRTFSEILNINYIVDPNIRGRVTIHVAGSLGKSDILPVFYQILEANGLTAVQEGKLYRIVKMKESPRLPLLIRSEGEGGDFSPDQRMMLQIVPLKFISAQEMSKVLTPFLSADGTILAHDGSNVLLIVDKGINVLKCLKLVEVFDANVFERVSHRFYFLENTKAEDLAKILKEVLSSYSLGKKDDVKVIPIERLNALLIVSPQERALDEIEPFLKQIDVAADTAEPQIYVYFVKNGEAKQLGSILDSIFTKGGGKQKEETAVKGKTPTNPLSMAAVKEKEEAAKPAETAPATAPASRAGGEDESGAVRGEVEITVDEVRNALVIKAFPRDYHIVEKVLLRLDIMPRQVLIEAMIAEITLNDNTNLGIDWTFDGASAVAPLGGLSATIGSAGLNYSVQLTNHWKAVINAFAEDKRVNVLSSPHVLASDNKEAKIDVSDEIPVATTTYSPTTTTQTGVYETSVQYRDTGIILTVTPHINDTGMVTMDISQEVSEPDEKGKTIGTVTYPVFKKRVVDTTLTLKHGQTLVIGGLIREKVEHNITGLPCLVNVPVLRFLGGKEEQKLEKKELILMITPRVVTSLEDVDAVTDEFKKKVKNVSLKFGEYKKTREFLKP